MCETFQVTAPARRVIGNQAPNCQLRSKAQIALTAPLFLHRTRIGQGVVKNSETIAKYGAESTLFYRHLSFFSCKNRNECSAPL
jgi:hypothetical protein